MFPFGPIKYGMLTPPWLCGPVRFVGKNNDPIYFYTEISIPRKAGVSNRRGKHLKCVVLAAWFEKEPAVREALVQALQFGGVHIDGEFSRYQVNCCYCFQPC